MSPNKLRQEQSFLRSVEVGRHCATFYSVSGLGELPPIATNSAPQHVQIYEFDFDKETFGKQYLSENNMAKNKFVKKEFFPVYIL